MKKLIPAAVIGILSLTANASEYRNPRLKYEACLRDHIPWSQCHLMEGDHIWPLCAGGPDILSNIQLQPCDQWNRNGRIPECIAGEAWRKDKFYEWPWCDKIRNGTATKEQAGYYFLHHKLCPPGISGCW